jgi:hypothetical protein
MCATGGSAAWAWASLRRWIAYWSSSFSWGASPWKLMYSLPRSSHSAINCSASLIPDLRHRSVWVLQNSVLAFSIHNEQNDNRHSAGPGATAAAPCAHVVTSGRPARSQR